MHMENWKFLINRLLALLGMLGTFIGTTFGYNLFLISNLGSGIFFAVVGLELLVLSIFGLLLLLVVVDMIKDNKKQRRG